MSGKLVGAGNLIKNSTFDGGVGLPWTTVETYPAHAEFDIENGKYNVTIVTPPDENRSKDTRWAIQLRHRGLVLEQGHTYTVQFTVTSTADCKVYPKVGQQAEPYLEYWNYHKNWETVDVRANVPTTITEQFTMTSATDRTAEFTFHLVGDCLASTIPYTVSFDDIYLKDPLFQGYEPEIPEPTNGVRINQVGYFPNLKKEAVLVSSENNPVGWKLVDSNGNAVYSGKTTVFGYDKNSGDNIHLIDFSNYTKAGKYKIVADESDETPKESMTFEISKDIYSIMKDDAMKYFYHNRSGIEIKMPYCGRADLARPAGHPSDIMATAPGTWYPDSYKLDVTGGWYDAGDHGKYVVNAGVSTWTLLNQYERAKYAGEDLTKAPLGDNTMNIPESGNGKPDILDEAKWSLDFMLKMQVPDGYKYAGMVHHKGHDEFWTALGIRPDQDPQTRYIKPPSTAATLNLAAVAAQGARIYKEFDSAFASKCLVAAEKAYDAAIKNPSIYAPEEDSIGGGAYNDNYVKDEFYWAASELYITTGKEKYLSDIKSSKHYLEVPTTLTAGTSTGNRGAFDWGNVEALGTLSLAIVPNNLSNTEVEKAKENIKKAADEFINIAKNEGYGVPLDDSLLSKNIKGYPWGSNSFIMNEAIVMAYAYDFSDKKEAKYINGIIKSMDYLLGCNPNVQSYVTGYGSNPLENPHHRFWSYQTDSTFPKAPSGCISGGPNSELQDPWVKGSGWKAGSRPPQKCFMDNIESWSTNEITINWNAPFAWLISYLDTNANTGSTPVIEVKYGDINGDGKVNSNDLLLMRKYIVGISKTFAYENGFVAADVDGDKSITVIDYDKLNKFILGKILKFPIEN